MMVKTLNKGTLHITDEVVALIAEAAVSEMPGIFGTVPGLKDEFARVVHKQPARGITVYTEKDETVIEAKVAVRFGENVGDVCFRLQERIKHDVEMMTGMKVGTINLLVDQIVFEEE
ncbi:MAG TPA: Asp23/Gls24 family envelope stress response protein [Bacillales bacterium]|nr:Asp23/Gls24 family envelope stress response protein [Bacillales bacterium]